MKAIINVKGASAYSICNGHTFEVFKLWSHSVDVIGANPEFPNAATNFTFDEIIIPDLGNELAQAKKNAEKYGGVHIDLYDNMKKYCERKRFKHE